MSLTRKPLQKEINETQETETPEEIADAYRSSFREWLGSEKAPCYYCSTIQIAKCKRKPFNCVAFTRYANTGENIKAPGYVHKKKDAKGR